MRQSLQIIVSLNTRGNTFTVSDAVSVAYSNLVAVLIAHAELTSIDNPPTMDALDAVMRNATQELMMDDDDDGINRKGCWPWVAGMIVLAFVLFFASCAVWC